MYKVDKEQAKRILVEEENYTPYKVAALLEDYPPLHDELGSAVDQWLRDRTVANVSVEGLPIDEVMEKRHLHFLVAVRKMNKLLDESIPVEEREKLREILATPAIFE